MLNVIKDLINVTDPANDQEHQSDNDADEYRCGSDQDGEIDDSFCHGVSSHSLSVRRNASAR